MAKALRPKPVVTLKASTMEATLFGLPLTYPEAHAFSDVSAGHGTPEQKVLLMSWVVKMSLLHGLWVTDAVMPMIEAHVPDLTCP
jgi:hypothetical protein